MLRQKDDFGEDANRCEKKEEEIIDEECRNWVKPFELFLKDGGSLLDQNI